MISSLNNPFVIKCSKLQKKKYRSLYNQYLIEGLKVINEAREVITIITTDLNYNNENVVYVSDEVMYKIYNQKPIVKYVAICNLNYVEHFTSNKIVCLDRISDPGNMGTIIRTGYALGFDNFFIDDQCVDLYNDKVIKAMHGAQFSLNFKKGNLIDFLIKYEHKIITTFLDEPSTLNLENENFCLVFGNEANGIRSEIKNIEHDNFKIKTRFESLNVASASSIIMYDIDRSLNGKNNK